MPAQSSPFQAWVMFSSQLIFQTTLRVFPIDARRTFHQTYGAAVTPNLLCLHSRSATLRDKTVPPFLTVPVPFASISLPHIHWLKPSGGRLKKKREAKKN